MSRAWALALLAACYEPGALPDATEDAAMPTPDVPQNVLDFCPTGYELHDNGKYRVVNNAAMGWADAEAACEADRIDMESIVFTHLAVITSPAEHTLAKSLITSPTWIGYTDRGIEGVWRHVNGESPAYPGIGPGTGAETDAWNIGEPNNNGAGEGEDCAFMFTAAGGKLEDRPCTDGANVVSYMCECDLAAAISDGG